LAWSLPDLARERNAAFSEALRKKYTRLSTLALTDQRVRYIPSFGARFAARLSK
jgi:hypothetical protein